MRCAEDYLRFCLKYVLEHNLADLEFIAGLRRSGAIDRARTSPRTSSVACSRTEAIDILSNARGERVGGSSRAPSRRGALEAGHEHERYLAREGVFKPVIVYNYAKAQGFYMRLNGEERSGSRPWLRAATSARAVGDELALRTGQRATRWPSRMSGARQGTGGARGPEHGPSARTAPGCASGFGCAAIIQRLHGDGPRRSSRAVPALPGNSASPAARGDARAMVSRRAYDIHSSMRHHTTIRIATTGNAPTRWPRLDAGQETRRADEEQGLGRREARGRRGRRRSCPSKLESGSTRVAFLVEEAHGVERRSACGASPRVRRCTGRRLAGESPASHRTSRSATGLSLNAPRRRSGTDDGDEGELDSVVARSSALLTVPALSERMSARRARRSARRA